MKAGAVKVGDDKCDKRKPSLNGKTAHVTFSLRRSHLSEIDQFGRSDNVSECLQMSRKGIDGVYK